MSSLRINPQTFENATSVATSEANLEQRISAGNRVQSSDATLGPEPIDISHTRKNSCYGCGKWGPKSGDCKVKHVNVTDREIRCWGCNEKGHVLRNCKQQFRRPMGHGRPMRMQTQTPTGYQGN